jgi:glycine cleavage system H lipoate-binding protein
MRLNVNDRFWLDPDKGKLGLQKNYLERLGTLWTLTPKVLNGQPMVKGKPFMHFESSNCLGNFRAPCDLLVVTWNTEILDTPDIVTEETSIATVEVK